MRRAIFLRDRIRSGRIVQCGQNGVLAKGAEFWFRFDGFGHAVRRKQGYLPIKHKMKWWKLFFGAMLERSPTILGYFPAEARKTPKIYFLLPRSESMVIARLMAWRTNGDSKVLRGTMEYVWIDL
jgi:hypothetical protein